MTITSPLKLSVCHFNGSSVSDRSALIFCLCHQGEQRHHRIKRARAKKRLNLGLRKRSCAIAQGLEFSGAKDLGEIQTKSAPI